MKRLKKDSKKLISVILAIIMVIAMVLSLAAPFFAAELDQSIDITTQIGFEQKYRVGAKTPISIFLKNNGPDFKGEVQIKILNIRFDTQDIYSSYQSRTQTIDNIYSQALDLPQGGTKKLEFNITMPSVQKSIEINLVQNEKIIMSKTEKCTPFSGTDTLVAVLSDNKEDLTYLRGLNIRNYDYNDRETKAYSNTFNDSNLIALTDSLIFIDETNFPTSLPILNNFNALIINDYDTSKLNDNLNLLYNWLYNGGNLILGTGVNKAKVLNGLESIMSDLNSSTVKFNEFDHQALIDETLKTESFEILKVGLGKILVHSFDLGLQPIYESNNKVLLLSEIYKTYMPEMIVFKDPSNKNPINYWLEYIPIDNKNSVIIAAILIIFIYILIICPVFYNILKRKNRLEKAWTVMISFSLIITLTIYLISFLMPYHNPILNSVSFVEFKNNKAKINKTVGVLSPEEGDINLKFNNNLDIVNDIDLNYNNYNNLNSFDIYKSEDIQRLVNFKMTFGDQPKLTFYNKDHWDLNELNFQNEIEFNGGIETQISFENKIPTGEITNTTGYKLENIIVLLGTQFAYCDYLETNQTKEIEFIYSTDNYYKSLEDIFPKRYDSKKINEMRKTKGFTYEETKKNMRRSNLISRILSDYNSDSIKDPLKAAIYSFSNIDLLDIQLTVNDKIPTKLNETIFSTYQNIKLKENTHFNILENTTQVTNSQFEAPLDISQNNLYLNDENQTIKFKFNIPVCKKLNSFELIWDTQNRLEGLKELQIYNVKSGIWEPLDFKNTKFDINTESYVDKDRNITFRFTNKFSTNVILPYINIEGEN